MPTQHPRDKGIPENYGGYGELLGGKLEYQVLYKEVLREYKTNGLFEAPIASRKCKGILGNP